jgi:hypothetical protein
LCQAAQELISQQFVVELGPSSTTTDYSGAIDSHFCFVGMFPNLHSGIHLGMAVAKDECEGAPGAKTGMDSRNSEPITITDRATAVVNQGCSGECLRASGLELSRR